MSAELAEILHFPAQETGYPEIDEIIKEALDMPDLVSVVKQASSPLQALIEIRSEIIKLFPRVANFPDRPDDREFQELSLSENDDPAVTIKARNTFYIAKKIIAAIRHH